MGYFRHHPEGAHDLAHLSTKQLKELVQEAKDYLKSTPQPPNEARQFLRKYEYELRRRSDA